VRRCILFIILIDDDLIVTKLTPVSASSCTTEGAVFQQELRKLANWPKLHQLFSAGNTVIPGIPGIPGITELKDHPKFWKSRPPKYFIKFYNN
jgi:hypothetical protein